MLHNKIFDSARSEDLVLHCTKVNISQVAEGGIKLSGHGALKINSVGTVYLEFICTEADGVPRHSLFGERFPEDPFDSSQKLLLSAETISGDVFTSAGFTLDIRNNFSGLPLLLYVFLYEIEMSSEEKVYRENENFLYFEFREKSLIPKNRSNSVISSLGSESHSWNQTVLEFDDLKVSIVEHESHVEVSASGSFDIDAMYDSIVFYIGMTSGCMPQAYGLVKRVGEKQSTIVRSINNTYRLKNIPGPIPQNVSIDGKIEVDSHFKILSNIYEVRNNRGVYFESAFSQWKRVWHGYNSQDNIAMLSLAVSIEGLLNDIFIPSLKDGACDPEFDEVKLKIIQELSGLDIDGQHMRSIVGFVEKWGNIHAPKALTLLVEKGLISEAEKKAWEKIRHSSAHPKFIEQSDARLIKNHERMARCLNLFYSLVLNVFGYDGAQYEFGEPRKPDIVLRPYVSVLGNA